MFGGGLLVSVDDDTPSGFGSGLVTTNVVTATSIPPGASFVWTYVSGDADFEVVNVNGASTAFRRTVAPATSYASDWRVTGTLNGQTDAALVTVTVTGV